MTKPPKISERERQRRKAAKAASLERDVEIKPPLDLGRRRGCLADVFLFLRTYFPDVFNQPFTPDRRAMILAICHAANHAGDYAIAGPRGCGKTVSAIYTCLWLILSRQVKLPLIVGKNQSGAENELENLKRALTTNELLAADFPEICAPLIGLDGWASRSKKQTANGQPTRITWSRDTLIFPSVADSSLPADWPAGELSLACGQGIAVVGIGGRIRGFNRRGQRPDLCLIDDIDDRESARSDLQTGDFRVGIEQDIGGLGGSGERTSRVMLCTIISRRSIAFEYTGKPAWRGQRFKFLTKLPDAEQLWQEYIDLRRNRAEDDPDARVAHRFYLERRAAMDAGAEVSNPFAFESKLASDGQPLECSGLQAAFNKIADTSLEAFNAEFQNEPAADDEISKAGISRQLVASRLSGLERGELPPDCKIIVGIDLGKHACHWVAGAFRKGGAAAIVNYGIIEVIGSENTEASEVVERAILRSLIAWRDDMTAQPFRDVDGNPVALSAVLLDSGYCQDACFEFCRRYGDPYKPTKGAAKFHHGTASPSRRVGNHWYSQPQAGRLWLYSLDTDHWKKSVHQRFIAEPLDTSGRPNPGSLSLFIPAGKRDHSTFSAHILAEEFITTFEPGKGERSRWVNHSANNHYLDATALCLAGAEIIGCGLFGQPVRATIPPHLRPTLAQLAQQGR